MPYASVEKAVKALKAGKMIILVDDPRRENEGDLVMAAEAITPDAINFMRKEGGGLICLSLAGQLCDALDLRPQVAENTSSMGTAFLESIEARIGVTTGISAADRATPSWPLLQMMPSQAIWLVQAIFSHFEQEKVAF